MERTRRTGPDVPRLAWALALALIVSPGQVVAQDQEQTRDGRFAGTVVDALTDRPITNALVVLDGNGMALLTDSVGRFDFGPLESRELSVTVRRYGYETQGADFFLPAGEVTDLRVPLPPVAVLVDGLSVVTERLETMEQRMTTRRKAAPMSVQAFDQTRLVRSSAQDVLEMLAVESVLQVERCGNRAFAGACVRRRGRMVEPRVYVDEMPVIGGLQQLAMYRPYELYMVEIFGRGLEVRAYTHQFMERMARRPIALMPVGIW